MEEKVRVIPFTSEMKKEYTVLIPNMLELHFEFLSRVFRSYGYNTELLKNEGRAVVDEGLKYVHNDTCYPALLVIGQFIDALNSGKYDLNKTALMITQTGGGCRASNYIHLLRKALLKAGYSNIPVISFNVNGLEKEASVELSVPFARKCLAVVAYGDLLMLLKNQIRPYEVNKGECEAKVKKWMDDLCECFDSNKGYSARDMGKYFQKIVNDFSNIQMERKPKEKVGIVGEIYVKYSPLGNNRLEDFLYEQGCETVVPGLMHFLMYMIAHRIDDAKAYGGNFISTLVMKIARKYMFSIEKKIHKAIVKNGVFESEFSFNSMRESLRDVIGFGCCMGEGWLLTAEMMALIENGCNNIVCAQPFGCLPNHIVGKGMVRKLKSYFPQANIVPIDYDPGATKVNQENRIKLMLAVAKENSAQND